MRGTLADRCLNLSPRGAALSNSASASSFLSFAFACSSAFSRRALRHRQPAVLSLPAVERRLRNAVLAAQILGLRLKLRLPSTRQ
jgi:hypothetical protein